MSHRPVRDYAEMGKTSGESRRVAALEEHVARVVAEAPELAPERVERLRSILSGALTKLDVPA